MHGRTAAPFRPLNKQPRKCVIQLKFPIGKGVKNFF